MIDATIGGLMIGIAAVWLMLSTGRIAGVSGIVASAVTRRSGNLWAVLFILGIGAGGYLGAEFANVSTVRTTDAITWQLLVGAVLVGYGTRLGAGCTSGHGVCGIARLSVRSIVATLVFLGTGMITATWVYG